MYTLSHSLMNKFSKQLLNSRNISFIFEHRVKHTSTCLSIIFKERHESTNTICFPYILANTSSELNENSKVCYSYKSYHHEFPKYDIPNNYLNTVTKCSKRTFHTAIINNESNASTSGSKENLTSPNEQKHENIFTIPNLLCVSRIIASPYLAHVIINNSDFSLALGIFMYAGATDALDGWIARNFKGQQSSLGSFLDPLSDKILMTTMYLTLTYVQIIPAALTALVVSRDILLIYAGLYVRYMSVIPPFTLKKYFDMSLPSAQVLPTTISKINTMVQLLLVATALTAPIFDLVNHPAYYALCGITATTTFASAVSYAFSKSVYKFKFREHDHQYGKRISVFIFYILFNLAFLYAMPIRQSDSANEKKELVQDQ